MHLINSAVLLTPPGAAAIAVLRLAGPGVDGFLRRHFSRPVQIGRCVHGILREGERTIDDPVIVRCAADVIDINLHGGPWVVRSVIHLAEAAGFTAIPAGSPLCKDAIDGTSPIWQEVLQHLSRAATQQAARILLAQPAAWDYLLKRINDGKATPEEIRRIATDRSAYWLLNPPTVAIIGPPNVGKSTLANQLFAQERSITADLPGTTRDWVGEIANLDGLAIVLVDTPGIRETDDAIEHAAIIASGEKIRSADLVLIVLDQSAPLSPPARTLIDCNPNAIIIANKSDGSAAWLAESVSAIATVATTGEGIDAVRSAIRQRFDCDSLETNQPRCWTNRQCACLIGVGQSSLG